MSLEKYLRERDAAFEADDLKWAAAQLPTSSNQKVVEIAFHKARSICTSISKAKRKQSKVWLQENGYAPYGQIRGQQ